MSILVIYKFKVFFWSYGPNIKKLNNKKQVIVIATRTDTNSKRQITNTQTNKMATTQITFTPQQIEYLAGWFTEQGNKYVSAVMEDDFEADAESFERLMGSTFDATGLPRGNTDVREVNDKPSKHAKAKKVKKEKDPDAPKKAKSPYLNWLWSEDGVPRVKTISVKPANWDELMTNKDGVTIEFNPDWGRKDGHKIAMSYAAKVWKEVMDEAAKDKWVKMSAAQKLEYDTAMKAKN